MFLYVNKVLWLKGNLWLLPSGLRERSVIGILWFIFRCGYICKHVLFCHISVKHQNQNESPPSGVHGKKNKHPLAWSHAADRTIKKKWVTKSSICCNHNKRWGRCWWSQLRRMSSQPHHTHLLNAHPQNGAGEVAVPSVASVRSTTRMNNPSGQMLLWNRPAQCGSYIWHRKLVRSVEGLKGHKLWGLSASAERWGLRATRTRRLETKFLSKNSGWEAGFL